MDYNEFRRALLRAKIDHWNRPDYLEGFARGLRRAHHKIYGTDEEHERWLSLIDDECNASQERGHGYRDGLAVGGGDQSQKGNETPKSFSPSIDQIRAFVAKHGFTKSQVAKMAYISGGQAFRKYTGGASPHRMSGAVWFTLVAKTMLPPETVAEIEKKMLAM